MKNRPLRSSRKGGIAIMSKMRMNFIYVNPYLYKRMVPRIGVRGYLVSASVADSRYYRTVPILKSGLTGTMLQSVSK
jgi:hypothetical protein